MGVLPRYGPIVMICEWTTLVRKHGLASLVDDQTEILILGSLPSDESLSKGQYYAKPSNDFWKLLGAVLSEPLVEASYATRIKILFAHKIGLWDVLHSCVRPGSMDGNISETEFNDFSTLKHIAPNLKLICFNGQKAAQAEEQLNVLGYKTQVLPSSSGANRRNQTERLRFWREHLYPESK
jgi:double-stranded uracil-DNA glycosylase